MRRTTLRSLFCTVISALGVISLASCGENAPPANATAASATDNHLADAGPRPQLPAPAGAAAAPVAPSAQQASLRSVNSSAQQVVSDAPVPPRNAQWTLLAFTDRSATHVQNVNHLKQELIDNTRRREWYAIHGRDESNLYFGFYRAVEDPTDVASSAAAQSDRQFVRELVLHDVLGQESKPFKDAGFLPLSAPDPTAPPEWNLFNKDLAKRPKDPTRAYWSLQIMAFKANALRKEAAVQAVQALRKQGVEAYYYHGDTISSVCVAPGRSTPLSSSRATGTTPTPTRKIRFSSCPASCRRAPSRSTTTTKVTKSSRWAGASRVATRR